jgi:hypothetical protein
MAKDIHYPLAFAFRINTCLFDYREKSIIGRTIWQPENLHPLTFTSFVFGQA